MLVILLGVSGLGGRLLAWLPLPIAMGMFAGSLLGDVSRLATGLAEDLPVAGPTILAYLLGRALRLQRIPPLGLAVVIGAAVVALRGAAWPALGVAPPTLVLAPMRLDPSALLGVALPLVILSASWATCRAWATCARRAIRCRLVG